MMEFPIFQLERSQTLYENSVEINLTESGVHPACVGDLVDNDLGELLSLQLGYGYTDGTPALRQAIADWHPGAAPENVLVANGTSEANLLALLSVAKPGGHIVVITPNFMQLDGMARALGVEVGTVALRPENNWQPDSDAVRAAVRPDTCLITLCDPNNPTGVAMTANSRRSLVDVAEEAGVWLLIDEIYRGSEIDDLPPATAWGLGDKVIVTGGLAKSFGCPGLRMGWCIAPSELVSRMHERQDYTTIGTGALAQYLARRCLVQPLRDKLLQRGRNILRQGREQVAEWVSGMPGWSWVKPDASGMAFLSYPMDVPSDVWCANLRKDTGVFVCAGAWFGIEGHIRLGFGVESDHLRTGLARISEYAAR